MNGLIRRTTCFVGICLLGFAIAGCKKAAPSTFNLSGTVRDDGTAAAPFPVVAGATVQITDGPNAGLSTTTDASGNYTLAGVTSGTFTMQVSATDHTTKTQSVTLSGALTQDFSLAKTKSTITFRIDQTTCGTASSNPIVDVYIDVAPPTTSTGTLYNVIQTSQTFNVTVGSHTLRTTGGRAGVTTGPTVVSVPGYGYTLLITCS